MKWSDILYWILNIIFISLTIIGFTIIAACLVLSFILAAIGISTGYWWFSIIFIILIILLFLILFIAAE